jgi:pimeloyl-ACP methyl ester carboxylesterase
MTTTTLFGNLAGDLIGEPGRTPPLVLLHGLTFDRTSWHPVLAELTALDPGRQVLTLDLPGHGESPPWTRYDLEPVAGAVHRAVAEAGLSAPVLAGHSAGGVIATIYAARYPARGVVNVDQPLQVEPFAQLVRSLAGPLRGPGFAQVWEQFEASMGIGLLPQDRQELLRSHRHVRQDLVTGYWREVLDEPPGRLAGKTADGLAALRDAKVPYLFVAGHELDDDYLNWQNQMLPQAEVTVWPGSGHFPHLAQPGRFAELLAVTARWA